MKAKSGKSEKVEKDEKKSFPLRLPKSKLKALKLRAIEGDTSVQKILENLIDLYLAEDGPTP